MSTPLGPVPTDKSAIAPTFVPSSYASEQPLESLSNAPSSLLSNESLGQPLDHTSEETPYKLHRRFDRMGRLVGDSGMKKLFSTHAMVIGLGGVGSWAAEALARSGIGRLSLVDFDEICITNSNRQLHALTGLVGKKKALVMGERIQKINPQCEVAAIPKFYNSLNADEILACKPEWIIDAIDNITAKCHLLSECKKRGIHVISSGGSGGKLDPTQIQIKDLSETEEDPLCRSVRRILRSQYGFPEKGSFGIATVFSKEKTKLPEDLEYDGSKGFVCVCPQGNNGLNTCDQKNQILGNASFVTGAFGLAAASWLTREICK